MIMSSSGDYQLDAVTQYRKMLSHLGQSRQSGRAEPLGTPSSSIAQEVSLIPTKGYKQELRS